MAKGLFIAVIDRDTRIAVALPLAFVAWGHAERRDFDAASLAYNIVDTIIPEGRMGADISLLRHTTGPVSGYVEAIEATENVVWSVWLTSDVRQSPSSEGMTRILRADLEKNIQSLMDWVNPGFHRNNIDEDRPHVMVMSSGRCGTMSLFRMLQNDGVLKPHHSYWFQLCLQEHMEMMCRIVEGNFDGAEELCARWYSCRAAEWLSGTMVGVNHMDTLFAPLFAVMHPKARFVYLRRNPKDVFKSFFTKKQFSGHIQQMHYAFDPDFRFCIPEMEMSDRISWYMDFTEQFCRAFGRLMGDRWVEISADKLFVQDREEVAKLLEFTGSDIDLDFAVEHFSKKINEKAHKCPSS